MDKKHWIFTCPGQGKRQALTIATEFVCATTNGGIAIFLARRFSGVDFVQYTSIISLVSSFGMLSAGMKASIAVEASQIDQNPKLRSMSIRRTTPTKLASFMLITWYIFVPILAAMSIFELQNLIAAGFLIPSIVLINTSGGRLQGSSKFAAWRVITVVSTLIQVPLVVTVAFLHAPLAIYIAILAIPGLIFYFLANKSSPRITSTTNPTYPIFYSGFSVAMLSIASQLPYFYIRNYLSSNLVGSTGLYLYSNFIFINITATLGAYLLPNLAKEIVPQNRSNICRQHFVHLIPFVVFAMIYYVIGDTLIQLFLGTNYRFQLGKLEFVVITLSSIAWGLASSVFQERVFLAKKRLLIVLISLLALELTFLFRLPLIEYFSIHCLVGVSLSFFIPRLNK